MNHNETEKRDSMVVYRTFYDVMMMMESDERNKFICAVLEYGLDGKEPDFSAGFAEAKMAFMFARKLIDKANERYRKCVENGKKGGAPKGNTNARNNPIQPNSTQNNLYDNEYENDYENFYDNECVYEFDTDTDTDTGTVY